MSKTLEVLAEAGIIPTDILEEMVRWRVVPAELLDVSARKPVETGDGDGAQTREQLLRKLQKALGREEAAIRQTLLDDEGVTVEAWLRFAGKKTEMLDVPLTRRSDGTFLVSVHDLTAGGRIPIRRVAMFLVGDQAYEIESTTPIYQDEEMTSFLFDVRRA